MVTVELYKDIFLYKDDTLYQLLTNSRLSSLGKIETMDIQHIEMTNERRIRESIRSRIVQSQISSMARYKSEGDWDSSVDEVDRFIAIWSSKIRPRLNHLKASSVQRQRDTLASLSQL
jgi:hypothetical protein